MNGKAIAKECAEWIKNKAKFKSNVNNNPIQKFMNINDKITYLNVDKFSSAGLGYQKDNTVFNPVTKIDDNYEMTRYYLQSFMELWNNKSVLKIENSSNLSEKIYGLKLDTEYKIKVIAKYNQSQISSNIITVKTEGTVVELANKFDKYIYIDSMNGNDTTGDGTKEKPYSTLDKIAESGIVEKGKSYGVILKSGKYELTEKIFNLDYGGEINIIGDRQNTILKVNGIYSNQGGGKSTYNV